MNIEQVKEIIEQVGYQEFYRYFQEKTTLIEQQREEIEKLNNIINELENYIDRHLSKLNIVKDRDICFTLRCIKRKLQELKGSE